MNKNIVIAIAGVLVVIGAVLALNLVSAGTGNAPAAGDTVTINLGYGDGQYSPAEIRVKQGTKVRIIGDAATLTGCMTTVNIDGYGIKKKVTAGDNVIEFAATTPGTFAIHCNMGMGNGRLVVEDSSGTVPQAPASAGSGGMVMGSCCSVV